MTCTAMGLSAGEAELEKDDLHGADPELLADGWAMSDTDVEPGPVDYIVVAFPAGKADFSGEMAAELRALIRSNTVRVLDLMVLTKDSDGSVEANELRNDSDIGQLRELEADLAVLLAEEDILEIGRVMDPAAPWRCWCGRTCGPGRSVRPCADPAASS